MNNASLFSRDQQWLEDRLAAVWQRGFSDLVPGNRVEIKFGRVARTRLGSIRMSRDKKVSKILINRLFLQDAVPEQVVDATIAHELVHYLHGFSSPFEQKFCSPHAGGVVTKELKQRGFSETLLFQRRWLKVHWLPILREHMSLRRPGALRRSRSRHLPRAFSLLRRFF
jgi:hypothetical protein